MKRLTPEQYCRAVEDAKAAIAAHKARPLIRADRKSPGSVLAGIEAKARRNEPPTKAELAALAAAIADADRPKKRGRPIGSGKAEIETAAARAGLWALDASPLNTYRNGAARIRNGIHRNGRSRCEAVAEAMHFHGFQRVATYDAVAKVAQEEGRRQKRPFYRLHREMAEIAHRLSESLEPMQSAMQEIEPRLSECIEPLQRAMQEIEPRLSECMEPLQRGVRKAAKRTTVSARNLENHFKTVD